MTARVNEIARHGGSSDLCGADISGYLSYVKTAFRVNRDGMKCLIDRQAAEAVISVSSEETYTVLLMTKKMRKKIHVMTIKMSQKIQVMKMEGGIKFQMINKEMGKKIQGMTIKMN